MDSRLEIHRQPYFIFNKNSGLSWRTIAHNAQVASYGKFDRYDFGDNSANMALYGTITPPLYPLQQIKVPTAIFYSDQTNDMQDIENFLMKPQVSRFGQVVYSNKMSIPFECFWFCNHMDWFPQVIGVIEKFGSKS